MRRVVLSVVAVLLLAGCFHSEPVEVEKSRCEVLVEQIEINTKLRDAAGNVYTRQGIQNLLNAQVGEALALGCSTR